MDEKQIRADALIDVGILAVGLSKNPATEYCLNVIEDAVRGRIRALIPYTVIFGTHYILTRFYDITAEETRNTIRNLLVSRRINWHGKIEPEDIAKTFENCIQYGLDAWDGYLLSLMERNEIRIIYTLDMEHFGKIDWIKAINPIPDQKMKELSDFLERSIEDQPS